MKNVFFTAAAIAIPAAILVWIVWLFVRGLYTAISDWRLERELARIRKETARKQPVRSTTAVDPRKLGSKEPEIAFSLDDVDTTTAPPGTDKDPVDATLGEAASPSSTATEPPHSGQPDSAEGNLADSHFAETEVPAQDPTTAASPDTKRTTNEVDGANISADIPEDK